jgi:hypothetical protein
MNLSNGVEPADQSQPTATNSLIARNRSHTRKRAQRHHICRGLDCRVRRSQHLTLIPFLVPLTAPRCPLLGTNREVRSARIGVVKSPYHSQSRTEPGLLLGTVGYMSPERIPTKIGRLDSLRVRRRIGMWLDKLYDLDGGISFEDSEVA